jgi:hypothetical protein
MQANTSGFYELFDRALAKHIGRLISEELDELYFFFTNIAPHNAQNPSSNPQPKPRTSLGRARA